jgi:YihY family inner membrane protein
MADAHATDDDTRPSVLAQVRVGSRRLWGFVRRVLTDFHRNKGLMIAGALGYNTLLSIIPLLALILVALSHVIDERVLLTAIDTQAGVVLPGQGRAITHAFRAFIENREVVGGIGFAAMLFFSTIAFRMLEDAMCMVFHRQRRGRPHPLRSFILPLAYVGLIGLGIFAITLVAVLFEALPAHGVSIMGYELYNAATPVVKILSFLGLVALLSSFYSIMPMAEVKPRRALIGGLVAAVLWETVRAGMIWYFENLSLVDVVYGSLATVVVLLLGAQVIAELQNSATHGVPWWAAPQ